MNSVKEKRRGPSVPAAFLLRLVLDVRHKSHETCALDSGSKVSLPFGSEACPAAIHHASVRVDGSGEADDIFEVDVIV